MPKLKPKYDEKIMPQLCRWMSRCGLTNAQMGLQLGISKTTLSRWSKKHPELAEALREGRDYTDSLVEDALLKRAKGFSLTEREVHDTPKGEKVVIKTKEIAPDTTAIIFWLKNRRPESWRDVRQLDLDMANKSTDELLDETKELMALIEREKDAK